MLKKIFGNAGIVAGFWFAFLAFGAYLFVFSTYPRLKVLSGGIDLPEEIPGASWDFQMMFLDAIGDKGIALYRGFQILDYANAFLLALVVSSTLYLILTRLEAMKFLFYLCLLPVIAALFDFAENTVMLINLGNFPTLDKDMAGVFMRLTQAKMLFALISVFSLVTAIVALAVNVVKMRFSK